MFSGRLSLSLALTCGFGLFSVGCLSKRNEQVSAEAAPPPAAYPADPSGYGGVARAQAPGAYGGTSVQAAYPRPAPFELRDNEELITHLIVSGESLYSISGKYNSSISRIMSANGMSDTTIYAGKSIQVPVVKSSSQVAMNNAPKPTTPTPSYGSPAPTPGYTNPSAPAPPATFGTPSSAPVYPGTTADPSSTSYPRQTTPTAPAGSFPTPSF